MPGSKQISSLLTNTRSLRTARTQLCTTNLRRLRCKWQRFSIITTIMKEGEEQYHCDTAQNEYGLRKKYLDWEKSLRH